jgi:hypothetical protein
MSLPTEPQTGWVGRINGVLCERLMSDASGWRTTDPTLGDSWWSWRGLLETLRRLTGGLTIVELPRVGVPAAEGWELVDAVLCQHESVLICEGVEGAPLGSPGVGCACGVTDLPADPDDMIRGALAWRRHRAEAVMAAALEAKGVA